MYLDTLNHLGYYFFNIGEKDASVAWLKQGWEICRDLPPATYLEPNEIKGVMPLIAGNYIFGLKQSGLEATADKITMEVDELKKRIAEASAEKKE